MKYPLRPNYSKGEIDRAGIAAASSKPGSTEFRKAVTVIDNWRAAHSYPMHTFNVTLRRKALLVSREAIVARRLKRLPTILDKIHHRESSMRLSRMQDIGGVRAIMPSLDHVYELFSIYTDKSHLTHKMRPPHDYIQNPKASGYRGIHLVYEFNNSQGRSANARDYDGLNIEVQIRTRLQHEWATAVEIVGTITRNDLKSSMGDSRWLEFFACMSSVMATLEGAPVLDVHKGWPAQRLYKHTTKLVRDLDIINMLAGWVTGVRHISEGSGSYYHILLLDTLKKQVRAIRFKESELEKARIKLSALEKKAATTNEPEPVLVAAGDINKIKKAYPNYFLDMKDFLEIVSMVVATTGAPVYNDRNDKE